MFKWRIHFWWNIWGAMRVSKLQKICHIWVNYSFKNKVNNILYSLCFWYGTFKFTWHDNRVMLSCRGTHLRDCIVMCYTCHTNTKVHPDQCEILPLEECMPKWHACGLKLHDACIMTPWHSCSKHTNIVYNYKLLI